jgi:hypothetical protein
MGVTTTGACLCGSVRYSTGASPLMTAVCHCRDCQKQTGTAFSIVLGLPQEAVKTTGEMTVYTTTGVSSSGVHRHFCGTCGSPLYSVADAMPGMVFLKAGTLDDPSGLKPDVHMWCETAQPWVAIDPALPQFPQNPPMV